MSKWLIILGLCFDLFGAIFLAYGAILSKKSGVFPEITLSWTIEFRDMRDKSYDRFGGDRSLTDRNGLANPSIES